MSKEKECIKCGEYGAHYEDYTNKHKGNIKPYCKSCHAKTQRSNIYKRKYDITIEAYDEILELQGGVCWICRGEDTKGILLAVDHCHTSGEVRGLLCSACNLGLGNFKDDSDRLERAIKYLSRYPT
jgi:hypothetical protein